MLEIVGMWLSTRSDHGEATHDLRDLRPTPSRAPGVCRRRPNRRHGWTLASWTRRNVTSRSWLATGCSYRRLGYGTSDQRLPQRGSERPLRAV